MNSKNCNTSEKHVLILKLTDKLYLRSGEKIISLSNLSIYYTWRNIKRSYNNNKFKKSAPTWNDNNGISKNSKFVRHGFKSTT